MAIVLFWFFVACLVLGIISAFTRKGPRTCRHCGSRLKTVAGHRSATVCAHCGWRNR